VRGTRRLEGASEWNLLPGSDVVHALAFRNRSK